MSSALSNLTPEQQQRLANNPALLQSYLRSQQASNQTNQRVELSRQQILQFVDNLPGQVQPSNQQPPLTPGVSDVPPANFNLGGSGGAG